MELGDVSPNKSPGTIIEIPPELINDGDSSDEATQVTEPHSMHQEKCFRTSLQHPPQGSHDPSLAISIAPQSQHEGSAQRALEICTNYCRRLVSFLMSMVAWAQLKTIAVMIQLLTLTRTAFNHCKRMVIWAQSKTMAVMIQLLTLARTTFYHCKGTVTWTQMKTIAVMIQLLTFARTTFCRCKRMVIWAQLKTLAVMIQFVTFARTTFWHCKAMVARVQLNVLALLAILIPFARTAFRLFKVFFLQFCTSSYDITSDFLQGKQSFYTYIAFSSDASCSNQP